MKVWDLETCSCLQTYTQHSDKVESVQVFTNTIIIFLFFYYFHFPLSFFLLPSLTTSCSGTPKRAPLCCVARTTSRCRSWTSAPPPPPPLSDGLSLLMSRLFVGTHSLLSTFLSAVVCSLLPSPASLDADDH